MNCRTCEYPLWNIRARVCPECGTGFKPSEFEFVPSSVKFCCPGCSQPYYGTDEHGHLLPRAFECVSCHASIEMDEMVLLPADGVGDRATRQDAVPWDDVESGGWFKRYWKTCGMAMVSPGRLGDAVSQSKGRGRPLRFLLLTQLIAFIGSTLPILVIMVPVMIMGANSALGAGGGGGGGLGVGAFAVAMIITMVAMTVGSYIAVVALAAVWAMLTHLILKMGGSPAAGLGRTWSSLCYAGGANVITGIPLVGGYVGPVWWLVSAVMVVRKAQRVSAWRAASAVLIPPVATFVALVGGYVLLMVGLFSAVGAGGGFGAGGPNAWGSPMFKMTYALQDWPTGQGSMVVITNRSDRAGLGNLPEHGGLLIVDNAAALEDFAADPVVADYDKLPIAGTTLAAFGRMSVEEQLAVIDADVALMPEDAVAHRVGDVVFTYHGMQLFAPRWLQPDGGNLWKAVYWPIGVDGTPLESPPLVQVLVVDGPFSSDEFPGSTFAAELAEQNALRARHGLAPLPSPREVMGWARPDQGDGADGHDHDGTGGDMGEPGP